jgi:phage terminase large subunit-like protein
LKRNRIASFFPDEGPLRRELYPKHLEFFKLGAVHQERAFMGGNRTGKTVVGAFECTTHLTGDYPDWWEGRRFDGPTDWWAASNTGETTRDIIQKELFGPPGDFGTGMIPWAKIEGEPTSRRSLSDAIDTARIRHVSGGVSMLGFKSYDQGRERFQGTAKHGIWLDEESEEDVYDECLLRLMTLNGIMMCTFTPLKGLSKVALRFLPHLAPSA